MAVFDVWEIHQHKGAELMGTRIVVRHGRPATKGSTKSFYNPRTRKVVTMSDNPNLKAWELAVRAAAMTMCKRDVHPHRGPVEVCILFLLRRPMKHYKKGCLRYDAPEASNCVTRGRQDLDKLERAVLDALPGVMYEDDSQVVAIKSRKQWSTLSEDPAAIIDVVE